MKKSKRALFSLTKKQFLVLVLPLVLVAFFTCVSFSAIANKIIQTSILRVIGGISENIEGEVRFAFEPTTAGLNMLSSAISSVESKRDVIAILKEMGSNYPQCGEVYFGTERPIRRGGYLVTKNEWDAPEDFDYKSRDWYIGAKKMNGGIYASKPYVSQPSENVCISFSRAVFDSDNEFIGVVGLDLWLNSLTDIISKIKVSENTRINVVDETGIYLTNKDPSLILNLNYFNDTKLRQKGYSTASFFDGGAKQFIQGNNFFAVRKIGESPWYVVTDGYVSDFTGELRMHLTIIVSVVAVLILICVMLNAIMQAKTNSRERKVSDQLLNEMQNLVVAAKENAATSQDQSAAVKEIVATMEDNNTLSENISNKINGVSDVATKTSNDVSEGVAYLEENVRQLQDIANANQGTIEGIKSLGDKIENIWDIVTLINSVADQAKIIAFNAELEASSAGEAGRNFHIVATEIRRLADGIIDGTKEIKERITEIQQSSDALILTSESGTEKINKGYENAKSLENRFESIKNASEITAGSAGEITTIIQQQTLASEQILVTLRQIASGVESFTAATNHISSASLNLKKIAVELSDSKENKGTKEES